MASLMESVGGLMTSENVSMVASALGMDSTKVQKGIGVADATVLGSLSKTAGTPEGATSIMKMLPPATGGSSADHVGGLVNSLSQGGTGADMMNNVMGGGVNAVSGTLSKSLGFDVKPLLTMAVPIVMSEVAKIATTNKLDSAGVANMLKSENNAYMADPANKQVANMVQTSLKAGDDALALKNKFSDADWTKVRLAPLAAVYLVATASPSGEAGQAKELAAAAGAVCDAIKKAPPTSLIGTAFGGGLRQNELDLLKHDAPPREQILSTIRDGVAVVQRKSPADAASYRSMINDAAQRAAEATKEGGFLGIGGTSVTAEEKAALNDIRTAVG